MRVYLLVISLPTADDADLVAFYHEGYLRASAQAYPGLGEATGEDVAELDKYAHITNNSFQKSLDGFDYDTYKVKGKQLRIPWPVLGDTLEARTDVSRDAVDAMLMAAILDAVRAGCQGDETPASRSKSNATAFLSDQWRPGQFAFLGVDFILGHDGRPYLIEFSKAPGVRDVPAFLGVQNRELMTDLLDLVLQARDHWRQPPGPAKPSLKAALAPWRGSWKPLVD